MTKKIKSKYNSATAEKALPVGKQPAQQQPDAACQPGNEWVFRYELRYPSSCGLLCWISSVVFVRCTPLALSAGKKEKSKKKSFFLSLPERMCCTFFSAYLFPAKNGKSRKKIFFSFSARTHACFFVSAYLFPAKNGKNRIFFFFSFSARTHKRVRARKTTRAIQLRKLRKVSFREENKSFPPGLSVWRKTNKKLFFKKVCFWKEKNVS